MYWLAVAFGGALLLALVTGAKPIRLALRLQSRWLLVVGLAVQVALEFVGGDGGGLGFGLLMLSYALLLAFCLVNLRVWGMAVLTLGVAMNAVVIGLNEGSPTRDRRVETRSGHVERPIDRTVKERPESDDDLLGFLGQVVRLPDNPVDEALSPGDLAMALGVLLVLVVGARRRRVAALEDDEAAEQSEEVGLPEEAKAAGPVEAEEIEDAPAEGTPVTATGVADDTREELVLPVVEPAGRSTARAPRSSGWRYEPVEPAEARGPGPAPEPEPSGDDRDHEPDEPAEPDHEPEPQDAPPPADDVDAFRAELEELAGDLGDERPDRE